MEVTFGAAIRRARQSQGLSLRAVAREVGVSPSLLSQVETGKTQPSVTTLCALAVFLGVSLDEVLQASASPPIAPER